MRRKKTSLPPPAELQQALDWLAEPEPDDPLLDLVPLRKHIAAIGSLDLPLLHRIKIHELLEQRAGRIDAALLPMLLDAKLPLPVHLGTIAQGLMGLRAELGETWLKVAGEADAEELAPVNRSRTQICLQGIANLARQFIVTQLISTPTPLNFWRNVQALYHRAHESVDPTATLPAEISAIDARLKAILALTAAQPEGLTPREIVFLAEYLEAHATHTRIDVIRPEQAGDWIWLDANLDQAPVSLERMRADGEKCIYIRFGDLASLAAQHLEQLNDGAPPKSLGLPLQAAGADYRNALERARQCWAALRRRSFNRRPQSFPVDVCTQLSSLWTALESGSQREPDSSICELTYSDWTVLNEGPSGYAIVHVVGAVTGIVPGCAVGLRTGPGAAWQICLVRWARSKNSSHVELGLEVVAPSAKPVRLQALTNRNPEPPVPALLLPALPSLNRSEALLTARGDYNARPFTLLQEQEAHLQVVECMPQRSLIETSSTEVFEFIRNPAVH
jgi:cyclic-di-GMP-binding protein